MTCSYARLDPVQWGGRDLRNKLVGQTEHSTAFSGKNDARSGHTEKVFCTSMLIWDDEVG